MMKWIIALLLVASVVFASEVILYEDFEGSVFPPEGWYRGSGSATRAEENGNHYLLGKYSHGQFLFVSYPLFEGQTGEAVTITFKYKINGYFRIMQNREVILNKELPISYENWVPVKFCGELLNGDVQVSFVSLNRLFIDNILIERCFVGIEPNSLGSIKALYR